MTISTFQRLFRAIERHFGGTGCHTSTFLTPTWLRAAGAAAMLLAPYSSTATEPYVEFELTITNHTDVKLQDHQVELTSRHLKGLSKEYALAGLSVITRGKSPQALDSQVVDIDQDGNDDTFLFNVNVPAKGETKLTLAALAHAKLEAYAEKPRAQVDMGIKVNGEINQKGWYVGGVYRQVKEMSVPASHVRGNRLFRYEGFGWESDKVGYRYYFDERSTIDIFGKRLPANVLQDVGHQGENYHNLSEWGVDVLKVGNSLGIGSLATYENKQANNLSKANNLRVTMVNDGPLYARLNVNHDNWPAHGRTIKVQESFSIVAGSRLTKADIQLSRDIPNITTGIVKTGLDLKISNEKDSDWGYIATYGNMSLADDNLGMAVFFKTDDVITIVDDDYNHLVVLRPRKKSVSYYFGAAWVQEFDGVKNEKEFDTFLENTRQILNDPVSIQVNAISSK